MSGMRPRERACPVSEIGVEGARVSRQWPGGRGFPGLQDRVWAGAVRGVRAGAGGGVWLSELWLPGRVVLRIAVGRRGCCRGRGWGLGIRGAGEGVRE